MGPTVLGRLSEFAQLVQHRCTAGVALPRWLRGPGPAATLLMPPLVRVLGAQVMRQLLLMGVVEFAATFDVR